MTALPPPADRAVREHLRALLTTAQAHLTLEDVLRDFPPARVTERVHGLARAHV